MQSNLESFEEIRTPKRTRRSKKSSGYFMCFPFHPWAKWAITGGSTDFSQRTWPHKWALFQAWAGVESHFMTLGRRSQWERLAGRNLNLSRRCSKQDYKKTDGAQHYFEKMRGAWTFWKVDTEKAHQWAQKCHQWQRTAKQIPHQFFKKSNHELHEYYHPHVSNIFQKIQEVEERRIVRIGESKKLAVVDQQANSNLWEMLGQK